MAGKHRKRSRFGSTVAKRGGTRSGGRRAQRHQPVDRGRHRHRRAAVAPNVELMALVSAANSTSQFFAGIDVLRHGLDERRTATQQVVPFLLGPAGHRGCDQRCTMTATLIRTGVTASGWGAGQTGTALGSD